MKSLEYGSSQYSFLVMDNLPKLLSYNRWPYDYCLFRTLRLVVYFLGFPYSRASVHYLSNCSDHWHGVIGLPDVPTHVNSYGSLLNRVVGELKRVQLCIKLRSSSHNQRHWTALDNFSKILAIVGLDKMGTQLCSDSTSQCKIARISFLQLLAHRRNSENRNTMLLAFIHKPAKVRQGLMLVNRPYKDRKGHRRNVQPNSIANRSCDGLVSQRIPDDASSTGNPKHNSHVGSRVNRGPEYSTGAHYPIRVCQKRLDRLPRLLQL